jgi:hypothetical protein
VAVYWAPLTRTADEVGFRKCANIVALGALSRLTGLLDLAQISQAVSARAPGKPDINAKALEAGYALEKDRFSEIIETDDALYLVTKTDERKSSTPAFEQVSASMKSKVLGRKRGELRDALPLVRASAR